MFRLFYLVRLAFLPQGNPLRDVHDANVAELRLQLATVDYDAEAMACKPDASWHCTTLQLLRILGLPDRALLDTCDWLASLDGPEVIDDVEKARAFMREIVTAYHEACWRKAVASLSSLRRASYASLQPALKFATYLRSPSVRARHLRTKLRLYQYESIGDYHRGRASRVGGVAVPAVPHVERGPCAVCKEDVVETVDHFLLHCAGFQVQRDILERGLATVSPALTAALRAAAPGTRAGDDIRRAVLLGGPIDVAVNKRGRQRLDLVCSQFLRDACGRRDALYRAARKG